MRKLRLQSALLMMVVVAAMGFAPPMLQRAAYCQETTGGVQGTVKDPTGAVVPKAKVVITSTALVGSKEVVTDTSGSYRFSNLPPRQLHHHGNGTGIQDRKAGRTQS